MTVAGKRRGVFYGWWVVAASSGALMGFAGIGFYSFGNLFVPIEEEFGWARAQISAGQAMFLLFSGITGVFVGRFVDRYGIRRMLVFGASIAAVSLLLLSRMGSLWHLYALYAALGIGLMCGGVVPIGMVITNWFQEYRGRAIGLAMLGIAFGAFTFSTLAGALVDAFSWRTAYVALAVLLLAVDLPLAAVLRTRPQEMGLEPDGRRSAPAPATSHEQRVPLPIRYTGERGLAGAARGGPFWLLAIAFFLMGTGTVAILQHEAPLIRDMGVSAGTAALALGLTGGIGAIGKVGFGFLTELVQVRYATMLCFGLQAIGALVLLSAESMGMVWVFVVVFGIGMGGNITVLPLAAGDLFPLGVFAAVFGLLNFSLSTGGGVVGPPLAGYLYDITGAYDAPLGVFVVAYLAGIVLTYLAWGLDPRPCSRPTKRPAPPGR